MLLVRVSKKNTRMRLRVHMHKNVSLSTVQKNVHVSYIFQYLLPLIVNLVAEKQQELLSISRQSTTKAASTRRALTIGTAREPISRR